MIALAAHCATTPTHLTPLGAVVFLVLAAIMNLTSIVFTTYAWKQARR